MRKLILGLFSALSLSSYGQGVNRCIDSIYAAYLANYTSPTPAQRQSSLQLATKQCNAMAGLVSDTGLVWADTLTYLATKSELTASASGWSLTGNTLPSMKYLGSLNNQNWALIQDGYTIATISGSGITMGDGYAISAGTSFGTAFGTATNQKISFYGATPITQPSGDVLAALAALGLVDSPTLPGGSGTVTSITGGYGLNGGTITTSGTLSADTSKVSTIATARRIADSAAASVSTGGTVTSIATSSPLTGGTITTSGTIGIQVANTSQSGYLSSTDWNTFNGKQGALTLTTTGTSGAATLVGNTLNVPQYAGGSGTVTSVSAGYGMNFTTITTSGSVTVDTTKVSTIATVRRIADSAAASGGSMVNSITASRGITASASTGAVTIAADTTASLTYTGLMTMQMNGVGTSLTDAVFLTNTTAATSGNPQYSPSFHFRGQNYSTASSSAQVEDWRSLVTTQSNSNPISALSFQCNHNGVGYVEVCNFQRSSATFGVPVSITSNSGLTISGKLSITTGTNKSAGTATLSSGTVTISTTAVTASSLIFAMPVGSGSGVLYVGTVTAGTSFVIGSSNGSDSRTINWWIIN
jgi:hypothetical protein